MKGIYFLMVMWMVISLVLVISVIGLVLFIPSINDTAYYKPVSERRSTWCEIGINLSNKCLK